MTNAQFCTFILDDGYRVDKFWMEAREAGVWQDGKVKDRIDEDWRDRPYSFGGVFEYDNYPVIGVNWYEALAFTRWLDMRWTGCGLLKKDWRVILPSEAEWEKAARGGLELPEVVAKPCNLMSITDLSDHVRMVKNPLGERIYPWGDKLDPNRLNMNETGIRITSSVGCFPGGSSPYGTEEMSGNTWEWTRSLYLPYPYKPGDVREDLSASRDHDRVQRGGSFYDIERFVRCAYRFRYYPDRRGTNTGFRVVVSPPSTSDL